jgi:tetratricopeptide (TPR) repeat protein
VLFRLGERTEAEALRRQALAAIESRYGADSPATLLVRLDLVHGLVQNGRLDEADELLGVAEVLVERWLDPHHRYRAIAADQRAEILLQRGDPGAAVEVLERSWTIVDRTFRPDDLRRVSRMNDLAYAYFESGRADESLAWFAKARALTGRAGPDSFEHGSLMISSGYVRGELEDYEGALEDLRDARRVLEPLFGSDHPSIVQADLNEARVLMKAGRPADALPMWETAVRRLQDQPRGERMTTAADLELADCLLELGHTERALAVATKYDDVELELPAQAGLLDFVRARAVVATDPARALALARAARSALGEGARAEINRIDAWLRAHDVDAARAR